MIKEIVIAKGTNNNGYLLRYQDEDGTAALEVFPNFGAVVKATRRFFGEERQEGQNEVMAVEAPRPAAKVS